MNRKITVEITIRQSGGFELLDPRNNRHYAHTPDELAELLVRLAHDPSMPQAESVKPTQVILEEVGTRFAESRLPGPLQQAAPIIGRAAAELGGVAVDFGRNAVEWIKGVGKAEPEPTAGPTTAPPKQPAAPRREATRDPSPPRAARKPDGATRPRSEPTTSTNTTRPRSTRRTSLRFS